MAAFEDRAAPTDEQEGSPFTVSVILREIFLYLSTTDLIHCSEVNRLWNSEARSVLRDFKTCVATNKSDSPCLSLRDLDADLSRMTVVPYNGLHLRIPNHPVTLCALNCNAEFSSIRNDLKLKFLKIEWEWDYMRNEMEPRCPVISLFMSILKEKHGDTVEEVEFMDFPAGFNIASLLRPGVDFPKLKVIRFAPSLSPFLLFPMPRERYTEYLSEWDCAEMGLPFPEAENYEAIEFMPVRHNLNNDEQAEPLSPGCPLTRWLDATPNLEILELALPRYVLPVVQQRYPGLIRSFQFPTRFWDAETRQFALAQPKLERLTAHAPERPEHIGPLFWDSLKMILISSAKTLKYLNLEAAVLARFRSLRIQPLENLETLIIWMSPEGYEDDALLDLIRRLNFSRLCPKLASVSVYERSGEPRNIPLPRVEVDLDEDEEDLDKYSRQICKLHVEDCSAPDALVKLARIFRHITSLAVIANKGSRANRSDIYVDLFRSGWVHLRSATIWQIVTDLKFNLDGAFCGLASQELAELQLLNDDLLKRHDLVPGRPGLSSLKSLTELHISLRFDGKIQKDQSIGNTRKFLLSRVTGHCLLSRMKELQVIVQSDPLEALKHLESFVKVIGNDDVLAKTEPRADEYRHSGDPDWSS